MYEEITTMIKNLHKQEWIFETNIPWVSTFYKNTVEKKWPQIYQPSLIFISSWTKNLYLNNKKYTYWNGKLILISSTTPIICEALKEKDKPFAWICINLNRQNLYSLIKEIKQEYKPKSKHHQLQPGILPLDINDNIQQAFSRLLSCTKDPKDAEILGPSLIREILYYTIKWKDAETFCDLILYNKSFSIFEDIIERINRDYDKTLSIEDLIEGIDMSISTFFRQFKAFTGYSPTQYIKDLRLNQAKSLLILKKISVKQAAKQVGYSSQSQFSREYKRYFGYAPILEQ